MVEVSVDRSGPLCPDLFTARVSDADGHTFYRSRVHNLRTATRVARWYSSYLEIPLRRTRTQTALFRGVKEEKLQ
jgi:hypothetical protein